MICMMIGHDSRFFDKFYEDHPDYKDHLKNRNHKKNKSEEKKDSGWIYYRNTIDNDKFYLNEKTIKKDGKFLYFGLLVDSDTTKVDELNNSYNSHITTNKVDCSTNKIQVEQTILYKKRMGEGSPIRIDTTKSKFLTLPPGTPIGELVYEFCKN